MINTFYALNNLDSVSAFLVSLAIGLGFGWCLERAGFGSSRRLSGVFYFRDFAVIQVMFSALVTAMLGLALAESLNLVAPATQFYLLPTYYGAYVVAGLLFGVGFVMGGWCPGTAAAGLASGKIDAMIFVGGIIAGSVLYNELYPEIEQLTTWGASSQNAYNLPNVAFVYTTLGISKGLFIALFTLLAIACFWGINYVERSRTALTDEPGADRNKTLKKLSIGFVVFAGILLLLPEHDVLSHDQMFQRETALLKSIAAAEDHMEPEELADRLMQGDTALRVVDLRPEDEYQTFHIRSAVNVQLGALPAYAQQTPSGTLLVLYSNGMTHPAEARDALARLGFDNSYILTDGLDGFRARCLKPASLRKAPVSTEMAEKIMRWRSFFSQRG